MRNRCLVLLLLLSFAAPSVRAEERSVAAEWADLKAAAVERLEGLARRANGRKLFLARDDVYEEILRFDPEHRKARSWLKYKRRDGVWDRRRYSPPRNRGKTSALAEHVALFDAWGEWWREEVLYIHQRALTLEDFDTARKVLAFALELHPADETVRALAGEVRHAAGEAARWILADTQAALANRRRFRETAKAALSTVPAPRPGRVVTSDRGDLVSWPLVLEGETVRAVGSVPRPELERLLGIAEAASTVFTSVFGIEARLVSGAERFPLYVTASRDQGNRFLATEPGIAPGDLATFGNLELVFLPTRVGAIVKSDVATLRAEATAHAAHAHFLRSHLGLGERVAASWAREAAALYLVWLQVGTREMHAIRAATPAPSEERRVGPFGRPTRDEASDVSSLADATTDWYAQAAAAIAAGWDPAPLAYYGLAVFVLEARPEGAASFFRDVAAQAKPDLDTALEKHLGRDLAALRPHLLRWLGEMSELTNP